VAFALGLSDNIYGSVFQVRAMLFALQAGESTRVARALAVSGGYLATGSPRAAARAVKQLARARAVAEKTGDPQSIAYVIANSAIAYYLAGRFGKAVAAADRAAAMFRDRVPGTAWEQATAHHFGLMALVHLGGLRELQQRQPLYLRDALDRGDVYAATCMRMGYANFVWLVRGNVDMARREVREAMEAWSKDGCHLEHFYELLALVNADLYDGHPAEALTRVNERGTAMRRALLLRIETVRVRFLDARARCTLAVASARARDDDRSELRGLLAAVERDARGMARGRAPWTVGLAGLLRASAASLRGNRVAATRLLRKAIACFDAADMAMHAAAGRYRLAALEEGDERRRLEEQSTTWMQEQGVADVRALVSVVAPGFLG
jgi:tetratricopeptide (TPR) repeat protein